MSFSVTDRPAPGKGGRGPKLGADELATIVKAMRDGQAVTETIAKPRKSVQTRAHDVRQAVLAAMGLTESRYITSRTVASPGHEDKDDSYEVTVFMTDDGLAALKAQGAKSSAWS